MPAAFRDEGICERPKVLRCPATGKFVMWMHLDDQAYLVAQAGVAVADAPTGPFEFVRGFRPINFTYPLAGEDRCREHELGGTYRDMTLFQDDDGQAYVFYSSESNWTMYICRLRPDYLGIVEPAVQGETWQRVLVKQKREAPAPFKFGGRYYLITSGCSGWAPNAADVAVADHVLGPYMQLGNPCSGPGAETTFESQSTFVIANPFKPAGHFIFMADRWKKDELHDSRYVWLPFAMDHAGRFKLEYRDAWDPRA
jgi:beta-galactosidase